MPLILPARTLDSGFNIDNSLRFNDDDGADLGRTPSADGNRKTFTFSTWLKIGNIPSADYDFFSANSTNNFNDVMRIRSDDTLQISATVSGDTDNGYKFRSDMKFRDPSAWYHIVVGVDTTQATNSNGLKVYVNGSLISGTYDAYNQNISTSFNKSGSTMAIGHRQNDGGNHYDGYISEVHFIDGTQKQASDFGETNDNGVWIPKRFSGSYGTNGFKLEFQDSGNLGDDTSGNTNDFTATNLASFDVTTDTPTNNFCTMNPLATGSRGDFREGNSQVQTNVQGSVPYGQVEFGTFFVNKGKWYYEAKISSVGGGGKMGLGWNERYESGNYTNSHNNIGSNGNAFYSHQGDIKIGSGSDFSTGVDSYTTNDIIGCAIDLDNNKVYWHKNGNYQDDPTPNPASNDGRSLGTATYNNTWTPWVTKDDTINNCNVKFNFGNPPYTNSSSQSDDNGYGDFEYDVPTGFYSLCTKNLAEYG